MNAEKLMNDEKFSLLSDTLLKKKELLEKAEKEFKDAAYEFFNYYKNISY